MNQQRWQQIKTALYEALELRRELRPGFIAKTTGDDTELRGELESLIAAHEAASDDFLNTPAAASGAFAEPPGPDPWVGKHIGPYQLIEEIGSGGMGEVYRAVRADDAYQKQVAIKLIRTGQDSAFVVQRFRNERQILASFEHPNIARLLDGGSTTEGLPYFVMELIRGEPIDRYCDHHRLDTTARLRLFLQVCAAVQYAHQRLIIHRDLKPSNILVKDDGVPVLLDFGIAKIIESGGAAPLPQQTLLRLMTPDYASPEQLNGEALTTASDVYSLGVVLYELLTGLRPNHAAAVSQSLVATLSRPATVKPSTAAGRAADSGAIREGTARRLRRRLRGDLDNILLMALRPEPNRRYDSVELFAEDIRRHLSSLPVHARRATFGYRTSRFVVRYAAGLMVAFILGVALIVGLLVTARAERAAQAQRLRAEHERNAAEFALAGQFEERAWAALHDGYRTEAARDALGCGVSSSAQSAAVDEVPGAPSFPQSLRGMGGQPQTSTCQSLAPDLARRQPQSNHFSLHPLIPFPKLCAPICISIRATAHNWKLRANIPSAGETAMPQQLEDPSVSNPANPAVDSRGCGKTRSFVFRRERGASAPRIRSTESLGFRAFLI